MNTKKNFWNNFYKTSNLIGAHRGYRAIRAENTMSAFEVALGKADFIELDVGFSKDGVAIILHDDTLERTSDVKNHKNFKSPYKVNNYIYDDIKKLDFSSWFLHKDPFDTIKNSLVSTKELKSINIQRILTLEEVLTFLKKNNFPVNIEIKDMKNTAFDKTATKKIVNIVKKFDMDDLILFSSFNHKYMKELCYLAPNITRAALEENKHPKNIVKYLKELKVDGYHCALDIFDENIFSILDENNFFVNVYTVNEPQDKQRLFNLGVRAIFTDFL